MMEIAEKYKQTDIGFIPSDWEVKSLDEIGKFSKGSGVKKDESLSGDIPCIRYGEIYTKHSDYIKQFYSFISEEVSNTAKRLKKGDILFAGSGETKEEIGKSVAFINEFEAYAGGDIVILTNSNAEPLFLGYLLNAPFIQKQKASRGQGDAVVHISATQLGAIKIPLPPTKAEQTAIATALSDADALISSLEKLIAKKRMIKQGAMQQLLQPKEGWEVKKLGAIGVCFAGGTPSTFNSEYWGGDIIWLPSGRVQNNILEIQDSEITITKIGLEESAAKLIKPNSVLVAITGATCGNIGLLKFQAAANQSVIAIEPNECNEYRFLYYSLLMKRKDILTNQTGSAQGGVNLKAIKSLDISAPNKEEQTRIATILSDMDAEINALETKLDKYRKVKLGMMQNLLTGKIRLI